MTARFYKHKILLDENFPVRSYFPFLTERFTVKHLVKDLKHSGWSDNKIFQFASKNSYVIVTFNVQDFVEFTGESQETGIVGVSTNLSPEDIDKKLTALFNKSSQKSLYGKVTYITG